MCVTAITSVCLLCCCLAIIGRNTKRISQSGEKNRGLIWDVRVLVCRVSSVFETIYVIACPLTIKPKEDNAKTNHDLSMLQASAKSRYMFMKRNIKTDMNKMHGHYKTHEMSCR